MVDVSIEQRVLEILRDRVSDPSRDIHRDDRLFEMLDSLDRVEVVMALEEEFELSVPDAEAEAMKTVGDLIDYILRHAAPHSHAGGPGAPDAGADAGG